MQRWCILLAVLSATVAANGRHSSASEFAVSSDENTPSASTVLSKIFDGCYSDTNGSVLELLGYKVSFDDNTNALCAEVCQEKGYAVASTQGELCFCGNDLPLPRLYDPDEDEAAGTDGPCGTTCPGAYTDDPCQADECCGGPNAYSVYMVGDIDVLEQLVRRVMANLVYDPDLIGELLTPEEQQLLHCQCYNGDLSVNVTGQSVDSAGYGEIMSVKLTRRVDGTEELVEDNEPPPNLEECYLDVKEMDKQIQSEEPIHEEPYSDWDIVCDNTHGWREITCEKSYEETIGFEESWTTEHGFDLSTTVGTEFESSAIFAKATYVFELNTGYSFTSSYTSTQTSEVTEGFNIIVPVPVGAKVEVRLFKSMMPVMVKWRSVFAAEGYVLVDFGSILQKKFHLSQVMTYEQRQLYAFGTIDYGERPTLIARINVMDEDGNVIESDEQETEGKSDLE